MSPQNIHLDNNYRAIFDYLSTAIVLLDERLNVAYINHAAESLFNASLMRWQSQPLPSYIFDQDNAIYELRHALKTETGFSKRRATLFSSDKQPCRVDYVASPCHLQNDVFLLLEIHHLDRMLRIEEETLLSASHNMTTTLARGLAHEIKNPLGGLRGAAQLLEKQLPSDDLKEYTQIIINESDRLTRLVDQLLNPHQPAKLSRINLHEATERVVSLVMAEHSHITLVRDYDPSIPDVSADLEQLIQAVLNIANNAVQAISQTEKPTLTIRTRTQRQFTINNTFNRLVARIDIEDNGNGIPDDIADSLFLPTVTSRAEGHGLGLSISQSIINQHDGLITWVRTDKYTTVFSIYLPIHT